MKYIEIKDINKRVFNGLLLLIFVFIISKANAQDKPDYPFRNPDLSIEQRVADLLSRLTPDEKVSQMMNGSVAIERLGIPAYDWWNEALHGIGYAGTATVFPQAIGLAATFNDKEQVNTYTIISDEGRAKYNENCRLNGSKLFHGVTFWTPNINIFRDPRWGRGQETYGEDPYLTSRMGTATVKGLQGDDGKYYKAHACAKHFAVHSGPESLRHSFDVSVSPVDLYETYLPAFKTLVQDANVQEVMCAYQRFDGQPCCGNNKLLVQILREKWGYDGLVVSDCGAIDDFYQKGHHETYQDSTSASIAAVLSGTDIECGYSYKSLVTALKNGQINEADLDVSLRRIIRARIELGMLDPDSLVKWNKLSYNIVANDDHNKQALKAARESIVLLKNANSTLPLNKKIRKIAVVGPNADNMTMMWGNYSGTPKHTTTILDGIKEKLTDSEVIYKKGCECVGETWSESKLGQINGAGQKGLYAEFFDNMSMSGIPVWKGNLTKIDYDIWDSKPFIDGLPMSGFSAIMTGTYTPDKDEVMMVSYKSDNCMVTINGENMMKPKPGFAGMSVSGYDDSNKPAPEKPRPAYMTAEMIINEFKDMAPLTDSIQMEAGKTYEIKVYYKSKTKFAHLKLSMGINKQIDFAGIANSVAGADAIVFVGGLNSKLEGEELKVKLDGFAGGDRTKIELPKVQGKLLKALHDTGKPVVFVLCSGSAMGLAGDDANYDALIEAWYPGQSGGTAVADVLFGDYNPAGRLPVTFYKSTAQLPDFTNYDMEGRTYRYLKEEPLYQFGYGLSYTNFRYSNAMLNKSVIKSGEDLNVSVEIKNTGSVDGDEVVQVYVKRLNDDSAPLKSLKEFKRIHIPAGDKKYLAFTLQSTAFEYYDYSCDDLNVKPGDYQIFVGGSSAEKDLQVLSLKIKE